MITSIDVIKSHRPTNFQEIEEFEELIQSKLPEEYKKFLLNYNGGHPVQNVFKLIKPINEKNTEAGISWFYALYDGNISNIVTKYKDTREQIPDWLLPIGYDSGGKICLAIGGEHYGKLYYWTTNYSFWNIDEYNYLYLIADSFTDFINGLYEMKYDDKGNCIRKYQDGTITITPE